MSVQALFAPTPDEDERFLVAEARALFTHLPRDPLGGPEGVHVYVMSDERGYVKVGISNNPTVRATALAAGNPTGLTVEFMTAPYARGYAMAIEAAVHDFLAGANLGREWFACPTEDAIWAVQQMASSQ